MSWLIFELTATVDHIRLNIYFHRNQRVIQEELHKEHALGETTHTPLKIFLSRTTMPINLVSIRLRIWAFMFLFCLVFAMSLQTCLKRSHKLTRSWFSRQIIA